MTAGLSDAYDRMDEGEDYYNYTARIIIEGKLSEIEFVEDPSSDDFNNLILEECRVLAGNPPWSVEDKKVAIRAYPKKLEEGYTFTLSESARSTVVYGDNYIYDTEYIKGLTIGDRYVFVGRYEPLSDSGKIYLGDFIINPWCEPIQPVEGQPENYLESEAFAPLNELIELTNSDLHTFDMVYTDDMTAIMRFAQGDMSIVSGRGLTEEDSKEKSEICVISSEFASTNSLDLGDKITLKLGTELFEQFKGLGAVAATRERYSPPQKTVELEIVGIYMDTDSKREQLLKPNWGYSINTIFVPKSLLPVEETELENHMFSPSEFSFTIDDAWEIPSYADKIMDTNPIFMEKELRVLFYDAGWPEIVDKLTSATELSMIAMVVLFVAIVSVTGLIVYLFIRRKKKEYAVMRALGTSKKDSARHLMLPLMTITIFAVLAGSIAAWIYTTNTLSKNIAFSDIKDYTVNTSIPIAVIIGCVLSVPLLVFIFAFYRLWRMGKVPPLVFLQDNPYKQIRGNKNIQHSKPQEKKREEKREPADESRIQKESVITTDVNKPKQKNRSHRKYKRYALSYMTKKIRRSVMKSILLIVLSALMVGAACQFEIMRKSYIDLCNGTEIKAKFINGLPLSSIEQVMETGYVTDSYYEFKHYTDFNYSKIDWVVTNDIAEYTDEEVEITYAKGYNESSIKELGEFCVVSNSLLEKNGLELGEQVHITVSGTLKYFETIAIDKYKREHREEAVSDAEILELSREEIKEELTKQGSYYTIIGSVTTPSGKYDETVFSPGNLETRSIFGKVVSLDLAEFTVADNLRINEVRSFAKGINTGTFVIDTDKIDNILKSLSLFDKLIPVILTAVILVEGLICVLVIMQTSKETTILRVLGTPRKKTVTMLILEQLFYCIAGFILGISGLLLYNGTEAFVGITERFWFIGGLCFSGCFIGSFTCSMITTNHKMLDLLQSKE